jgi:hypothetical protein
MNSNYNLTKLAKYLGKIAISDSDNDLFMEKIAGMLTRSIIEGKRARGEKLTRKEKEEERWYKKHPRVKKLQDVVSSAALASLIV